MIGKINKESVWDKERLKTFFCINFIMLLIKIKNKILN